MSMASVTNIRYDDMSVTDYLTTDSSIMMRQVFESCRRHDVTSSLETIMRGLLPPHSQHQVDSKLSHPVRCGVETTWNALFQVFKYSLYFKSSDKLDKLIHVGLAILSNEYVYEYTQNCQPQDCQPLGNFQVGNLMLSLNASLIEGWGSRSSSCHWRRPQVLCWGEAFIFKIKSVWRLFEKEYLHRLTFFLPLLRKVGWLVLGCVQFEGFRSNFNFVETFVVTIEQ